MPERRSGLETACMMLLAVAVAGCSGSAKPAAPKPPAPVGDDDELRRQLDEAIDLTFARRLSLQENAAWQIIHGAVAFKREFLVENNGERIAVLDYVLGGGRMKGWDFEPGVELGGRRGLRSIMQQGSVIGQGHPDQWFGYLSGCALPPDQTIVVEGETYTMADLVHQVEWDVPRNPLREYSWTLMGLSAYRPSTHSWQASDGQTWSLEKLIEIECEQDLDSSACGGSHRLVGLTLALNRHLDQQGALEGGWKLADERVREAVAKVRQHQNPDGSFSVHFLARPGSSPDLAQSLGATGHMFEFLVLALSEDEVREPWVKRAAFYLCDAFRKTKDVPLECGALYHSASGLVLYRERLFGPRSYAH